jgi:hypothetical protein
MHPEGPATGHFRTVFLDFPLTSSKRSDGSQDPKLLLMQPSRFELTKMNPLSLK